MTQDYHVSLTCNSKRGIIVVRGIMMCVIIGA